MYHKLLTHLAYCCIHHYKKVFLLALLATLILGSLAATLHINLSFLAIMPEKDPEMELFKTVTNKFGGSSDLVLVVQGRNPAQATQFADELTKELENLKLSPAEINNEKKLGIRSIDYKIDLDFVKKYGIFFADEKQLNLAITLLQKYQKELKDLYQDLHLVPYLKKAYHFSHFLGVELSKGDKKVTPDQISQFLKVVESSLELMQDYLERGEQVKKEEVHEKLIQAAGSDFENYLRTYLKDGYLFSPDGSLLLISIRLNMDLLRIPIGVVFYKDILAITEQVQLKYPGLKANYTGMIAMGFEDQNSTLERFSWLSTISLFLVIFLFLYISRLRAGPILVGIPLLMAMIWTFGLVKIGIGFVSLTSLVFAVLLFGLGIDFAVHLMVRFNEEYQQGLELEQAIEKAVIGSGRGIITGGLTTAMAFFSMCLARDNAAVHLGYTTGWGLICCLIAMLTVFPVLLFCFFRKPTTKILWEKTNQENQFINWWVHKVTLNPKKVLFLCCVLFLFFGYQLRYFRMEYDLKKVITRNMPSLKTKKLVQERFGHSNDFMMVLPKNLDEDRKFTQELEEKKSGERKIFAQVLSLSKFIPTPESQGKSRKQAHNLYQILRNFKVEQKTQQKSPLTQQELQELEKMLEDFSRKVQMLKALFTKNPKLSASLKGIEEQSKNLLRLMKQTNNQEEILKNLGLCQFLIGEKTDQLLEQFKKICNPKLEDGSEKSISLPKLPRTLRERFQSLKDQSFLIMVYPKNASYDLENIQEIKKALDEVAPNQATGSHIISAHFVSTGLKDFPIITCAILLILTVVLWIDFRSFKYLIFSLLPLIFSAIISMGIICISGATISILMLSVFPLIFGIGIDDGVHILHRYKESKDIELSVSRTGRAILLTTITTIVSFGALIFTNHNGLIGMGLLIGIGVFLCFVFSITILPVVFVLFDSHQENATT